MGRIKWKFLALCSRIRQKQFLHKCQLDGFPRSAHGRESGSIKECEMPN